MNKDKLIYLNAYLNINLLKELWLGKILSLWLPGVILLKPAII